jgi:hypothetical protein
VLGSPQTPTAPFPKKESENGGYQAPDTYDPKKNPDCKTGNPCGRYVKAYKNTMSEIKKLKDSVPSFLGQKQWSCAQAMKNYELKVDQWKQRWRSRQCHVAHGIAKGHASDVTQAGAERTRAYNKMRQICNKEMRDRAKIPWS